VAQSSSGSIGIVFKLLSRRDQIVERLGAQLRSILYPLLWLGCRNRDQ
jgi:hypothetical protein